MKRRAVSSVELMLVLALIAIAIGGAVTFSRLSVLRADLNAETLNMVTHLRLMQSRAMAGEGGTGHGVHLESNRYVLFEGETYSASSTTNVEKILPSSLSIQNVSLNGGGSDIIFLPPQGETSTHGSLTITSSDSGQSRNISVSSLGLVQY